MTLPGGLSRYDMVLLNTSSGKDSQVMIEHVMGLVSKSGFPIRKVVAVHCDLGHVEWPGSKALAKQQAISYGVERFEVVRRPQGDLLQQIEARGMFPSSAARYCTSDQKTSQVRTLITRLHREHGARLPFRVLNCLGIRAQESSARAKKNPIQNNTKASTQRRQVVNWFPIFDWTETEVWATIRASAVPHHPAYDLGMSRLSCCFCIMASRRDLLISARANPDLLDRYCEVEQRIGHTLTVALPANDLRQLVNDPRRPLRL